MTSEELDDLVVLVVSGTRKGHPYVEKMLDTWYARMKQRKFILYVGDASGVDAQAVHWAVSKGARVRVFKAQWKKFGPAAGPLRNQEMIDAATDAVNDHDAYVEGFFFPSVEGKGTQDCSYRFMRAGHHLTIAEVRERCL